MIELQEITGLEQLNSSPIISTDIGKDINDRFEAINNNFNTIKTSEFMKGDNGINYNIKECSFKNINDAKDEIVFDVYFYGKSANGLYEYIQMTNKLIWEQLRSCIIKDKEDNRFDKEQGTIYFVTQIIDERNVISSSLPYIWLDGDAINKENQIDTSCTIVWKDGEFIQLKNFPTLYYNGDDFCWEINGVKTDWKAQGPQGYKGEPGKVFIVRGNNVEEGICKLENNSILKDGKWQNPNDIPELETNAGCIVFISNTDENDNTTTQGYASTIYATLDNGVDIWYCYVSEDNKLNSYIYSINFEESMKNNDLGLFIPFNKGGESGHLLRNVVGGIGNPGGLIISAVSSLADINSKVTDKRICFDYDKIDLNGFISCNHNNRDNTYTTTFDSDTIFNKSVTFTQPINCPITFLNSSFNFDNIFDLKVGNKTTTIQPPFGGAYDLYSKNMLIRINGGYIFDIKGESIEKSFLPSNTKFITTLYGDLIINPHEYTQNGSKYVQGSVTVPKLTTNELTTNELIITVGEISYKLNIEKLIDAGLLEEI